jgi:hypothetical protein
MHKRGGILSPPQGSNSIKWLCIDGNGQEPNSNGVRGCLMRMFLVYKELTSIFIGNLSAADEHLFWTFVMLAILMRGGPVA